MAKPIDIRKVPVDVSDKSVKSVYNPLSTDFVHKFDGEDQVIPSGDFGQFPENIAVHLARHLAKRIVMQVGEEEREEILKNLGNDEKARLTVSMKPIPRFKYRVGDVAKLLVSDARNEIVPSEDEILKVASEKESKEGEKQSEILEIPKAVLIGKKEKKEKTKTETKTKEEKQK